MKNFIWQAILTVLLFIAGTSFSFGQSIDFPVRVAMAPGFYIDTVFKLPKPKPEIIYKDTGSTKIIYRDTGSVKVVYKDTGSTRIVYLPCTKDSIVAKPIEKFFSESLLPFEAFVDWCIKNNYAVVLDRSTTVFKTISINDSIRIVSYNGANITSATQTLFVLGEKGHYFAGFNIFQPANGVAFFTLVQSNIVWNNTIKHVNVYGGRQAYQSSRGGVYDTATGKVLQWAGTTIEDCVFKTTYVCVGVFSQDGPAKFLHMRNVDLYCDTAHTLYVHPNVSLNLYGVRIKKVGAPGLALHHYSNGGGEGSGAASNARYVEIRNCSGFGAWQISQPITGAVIMDSCDLAPYGIPVPFMIATNTRFSNGGSGAFVRGVLTNCTGTIHPFDGTKVYDGNFTEVSPPTGGRIEFYNCKIGDFFSSRAGFTAVLHNTTVAAMAINNTFSNKIELDPTSKIISGKWGWVAPAGVIEQLK